MPAARRADVAYIALQFAELVGCLPALERVLEDVNVTESTVYNRTLEMGASRERLRIGRAHLFAVLASKFPGEVPEDYLNVIRQQESFSMLESWFQAALNAKTAADFLGEMRK